MPGRAKDLKNDYHVPFESIRYRVALYADGWEGPEHLEDYGPFDAEAQAEAAAIRVLAEQEEPADDEEFWVANITCGELAAFHHDCPSGREFAWWCPDLDFEHGYSNVSWCAAEDYEVAYGRDRGKPIWRWSEGKTIEVT